MTKVAHREFPVAFPVLVQRIAILVAAAFIVGASTVLFSNNSRALINDHRITRLEESIQKIPEIDRNVLILSGKLDVMNQKLDDARVELAGRPPSQTTTTTTTKSK